MKIISYFTKGPAYESEAARLSRSLDRLGYKSRADYVQIPIEDRGSWDGNTAAKARVMFAAMREYDEPLLYVDVDAVFHARVENYFQWLVGRNVDFAAHWFNQPLKGFGRPDATYKRMLAGTLFFNNTAAARDLLSGWVAVNSVLLWREIIDGGGQKNLWRCVEDMRRDDRLKVAELPGRYCFVFDKPGAYPDGEPRIIEHTIASRENRQAPGIQIPRVNDARREYLAKLDAHLTDPL